MTRWRATPSAPRRVSDDLRLTFRGSDGYPIVSMTYEIVCRSGTPELLRSFLSYAASPAGPGGAGQVPLRHRVVDAVNRLA